MPKGMPIIVQHKITAKTACVIANSIPPKISQKIFNSNEVVSPLKATSLPKGKKLNRPSLKHCSPTGIPIIVKHHNRPTRYQIMPAKIPPNKNQIILPIMLIAHFLSSTDKPTGTPKKYTRSWLLIHLI